MRGETFSIAWRAALVGVLLLALGLPAYTQVGGAVGGVPSRLRVQSLGVGTAAPAGNGDAAFGDDVTVTGDVTAATLAGSGASLTALNASNVSSGTLADGRLSSNVPLLNVINTFTLGQVMGQGSEALKLLPGASDHTYMGIYADTASPSTRYGYVGVGSTGAATLSVVAEVGDLELLSTSGAVTVDGVASSDFARLSQENTFADGQKFQGEYSTSITGVHAFVDVSSAATARFGCADTGGVAAPCTIYGSTLSFGGSGGAVDLTPTSGTFTLSYTNGCSTTPTQAARWYKIGSVVTITVAAALSCTGDTTTFDTDAGDVPAAIRPSTSNVYHAGIGANNNGASVTAMVEIATNGEVIVNRCGAVTGTCDGGAWTGSGARGLDAWTVSYVQ